MPTYAEWIPTLDIPEQQIDPLYSPTSSRSRTAPLTNIALLHTRANRPAAIGSDRGIPSRLLQHLHKLLQDDDQLSANVPDSLQADYESMKRQLNEITQDAEASVDTYVCTCVIFVLQILKIFQPEHGYKVKQQSPGNSKLGIVPNVVVLDSLRSIKLLIQDKTHKVLEKHINTLTSLNVRFDWTKDNRKTFSQGSAYSILIKLVCVMLEQHLSYAFLVDGKRYCVLQATRDTSRDNVIFISSFVSLADRHFPFLSVILSSMLVDITATEQDRRSLAVPAALVESSMTWTTVNAPSNETYQPIQLNAISDNKAAGQKLMESLLPEEEMGPLEPEGSMRNGSNDSETLITSEYLNMCFAPVDGVRPPDRYTIFPHAAYHPSSLGTTQLEIGEILNTSLFASAFVADLNGKKVVATVAHVGYQGGDMLLEEAKIYSKMERLFDVAVPRCYGLFQGDGLLVLLTEYAGQALKSWSELSSTSAQQLYQHLLAIHAEGVDHGDLEERNVVIDPVTQKIKIIDFSDSTEHHCQGDCYELGLVKKQIGC